MKRGRVLVLFLFALFIFSCASVRVSGHPPAFKAFSKLKSFEKCKIGVLPFSSGHPETGRLLSNSITTAIMKLGASVTDRSYLAQVLVEQGISLSGITENIDFKKIGKIIDIQYLMAGTVRTHSGSSFSGTITDATVKFIDVVSGEVVSTAIYSLETGRGGYEFSAHARSPFEIGEKLADGLMGKSEIKRE
jgi:TolB-like protein